jgi:penicillin-binding protein 1C
VTRRRAAWLLVLLLAPALLALCTLRDLASLPDTLPGSGSSAWNAPPPRVLAREGAVLTRSYGEAWNLDDWRELSQIPPLVQQAFLAAEDRRFHDHRGADWRARLRAAWQNLRAGRVVSGASTISEQVVRMLHPRPRGLWTRWLEGFDALRAERRYGKTAILEFYLNQVPYAARRRGVAQAARWYFGRDLDTLSVAESLALAVIVRAPSRLDPRRAPRAVSWRLQRIAAWLRGRGDLSDRGHTPLQLHPAPPAPALDVEAPHFVAFARERARDHRGGRVHTTLSAQWQRAADGILAARLAQLDGRGVDHAAALVVEHRSGAIRVWSVATRAGLTPTHIDVVRSPRQPGSTLKPFVYALALEDGASPARMLLDAPLSERVGQGLHAYRNYSRRFHGAVSLRAALGNSLNIPAVRLLSEVGPARLLARLRGLGVSALDAHPARYGDGLALGNGALSLFELVQAYAGLANRGRAVTLCAVRSRCAEAGPPVFPPEVTSLLADILADPHARRLEFGRGGVLDFDLPTAVKTGTSSDHRDAWAVGFDGLHVVGVWMGNLDQRPMRGISGAGGPATPARLYRSPRLVRVAACADENCPRSVREWAIPGVTQTPSAPAPRAATPSAARETVPARITHPSHGLRMALDPRVPPTRQRFRFQLATTRPPQQVRWLLDGRPLADTAVPSLLWQLRPGVHSLQATVRLAGEARWQTTAAVPFEVLGDDRPGARAVAPPF